MDVVNLTDTQLIDAALQTNKEAFSELVRRHQRKCLYVARSYLKNDPDAEDQVQIAFLKAYEHLNQYRAEAEFSTWLSRIVANECIMRIRDNRRMQFLFLDDHSTETDRMPIQLSSTAPDPESEVGTRQLSQVLRREIGSMPPIFRDVVVLSDLEGTPIRETASRLGISVAAVKSRLLRARNELRHRMTRSRRAYRSSPASCQEIRTNSTTRYPKIRAA